MHDFDKDRAKKHAEREKEFGDKPFKFGGETFHVRANVGYIGIKRVAALSEDTTGGETFEVIESSVISMIDPRDDAHARFNKVIYNNDDPITFEDLVDLQNWLIGEQTNRPPTPETSSVSTPPKTGTTLMEASSTELEEVSTI